MELADAIDDREMRQVLQYWRDKCDGRPPSFETMDPVELPPAALPWLFVYRRDTGGRFICRLLGTGIVRIEGRDNTGRFLDEILDGTSRDAQIALFDEVTRTGLPLLYKGGIAGPDRTLRDFTRLLLPVAGCSGSVDYLFGMVRFGPPEPVLRRNGNAGKNTDRLTVMRSGTKAKFRSRLGTVFA